MRDARQSLQQVSAVLAISLLTSLPAPAVAEQLTPVSQAVDAFSGCVNNILSRSKATRAIKRHGYSLLGKENGTSMYITPDKATMVSHYSNSDGDRLCTLAMNGFTERKANTLAARFASQLDASPDKAESPRVGKRWIGDYGPGTVSIFTMKNASGGFFTTTTINVLVYK